MQRIDLVGANCALAPVARAAYVTTAVNPHFHPIMRANGIGRRKARRRPLFLLLIAGGATARTAR
jgi:hypothetical protein